MRVLLIGSEGSSGRKYKENLKLLGIEPYCYDKLLGNNLPESINEYDLAIIATPPSTHLYYLHALNDWGCPYIMCEKPLCLLPTDYQIAAEMNIPVVHRRIKSQVFVNHAYRFENGYRKLKELMPMVGEIRYAYLENAYLFKKLHPDCVWDDYEGVIFDDSHIINVSRFLFGDPSEIRFKDVHKGLAVFLWKTEKCLVLHNTNVLNNIRRKRVEIVGEKGNLIYNYDTHFVYFCPSDETERIAIAYDHQSHLFEALKYVVNVVKAKGVFEENALEDAIKDMEIIGELMKGG